MFKPINIHEGLKETTLGLLTNAILSANIKPGERLNESLLAREFHTSRTPIREAFQQLEEQGLIVKVPRKGMFVVSISEESIQKINSLRVVLEAEALRLGRANLTPWQEEKLAQMVKEMERMEPAPTNESVKIDVGFHRMIWSLSGNEFLEKILTSLTTPLYAHAMLTLLRREMQRMVLDSHRPLLEFLRGNSTQSAEDVMQAHIALRWKDFAKSATPKDKLPPAHGPNGDRA